MAIADVLADNHFERFTRREEVVAELFVTGMTNRDIAMTLQMPYDSVNAATSSILTKLGVTSRQEGITILRGETKGTTVKQRVRTPPRIVGTKFSRDFCKRTGDEVEHFYATWEVVDIMFDSGLDRFIEVVKCVKIEENY